MAKAFVATLLLGLAILVGLNALPLSDKLASCLPPEYMAEAKMAHLASRPAYDAVLFGNSRIHPARGARVAPGARVYNAAAGGTSFRTWVAMLEALDGEGKAPRVAVVAVDNLAFTQTNLVGPWPRGLGRLPIMAEDFLAMLRGHSTAPELASFLHGRVLVSEAQALLHWISPHFAWLRLSLAAGLGGGCGKGAEDGSYTPAEAERDAPSAPFQPYDLGAPLLDRDLDRLARIQAHGTRVILYESPLIPAIQAAVEKATPPRSLAVRRDLFEGCRRRGLECHPQPLIPGSPENGFWADLHHPPQRGLEAWLAGLLAPHLAGEGR